MHGYFFYKYRKSAWVFLWATLYDEEIRREIFGDARIEEMEVAELVTLIENKETARDAIKPKQ